MNDRVIEIRDLRKVYRVGKIDVRRIARSGSGRDTLRICVHYRPFRLRQIHLVPHYRRAYTSLLRLCPRWKRGSFHACRMHSAPAMRKTTVGFVFQKFNLLPNLTAADNIAIARYLAGRNHAADPQFVETAEAAPDL